MGIWQTIKGFFKKSDNEYDTYIEDDYFDDDIPEVEHIERAEVDMSDRRLRERYIRNLCDQMVECTSEIEAASKEYRYVTDYLRDCEIIDAIPEESDSRLINAAQGVLHTIKENKSHSKKLGKISEAKYEEMRAIAQDMPKALDDLIEHEDYKELVRDDLRKLEGEKVSRQFARRDARVQQLSSKNIAIIAAFAMGFVIFMLLILQYMFEMNVMPGVIAAAALGAITLTMCFSVFVKAKNVERRTVSQLNQIIAKQNTVKIRYVNTQNLIEYEYEKYHIHSSDELAHYWKLYQEERHERDLLRRINTDMSAAEEEYKKELMNVNVNYPMLWMNQAEAVVDRREMVELRHGLVARRQGLRKRIDYNTENRDIAKKEVEDIVAKYPHYAREILDIVSEYDR
ncbi:MAG: hypothetical protein K6G03_03835 [Lachnospiraceae bacterium]|nr:hypothetical protein [Lachnospiraceae bacterium]